MHSEHYLSNIHEGVRNNILQTVDAVCRRLIQWHVSVAAHREMLRNDTEGDPTRTCQAVEMVGTAPSLMARTYSDASVASMGPVMTCAPSRLGCARSKMSFVSCDIPCTLNSFQAGWR